MCNQMTKSGVKCKISPNEGYCHIHKRNWDNIIIQKPTIDNLKKEITNLNKTIEKKANKIKELNNNLEFFKQEVNELNNKINLMNETCEKYELIQKYTFLKKQLININRKSTPYKILSNPHYKHIVESKFNKPQDILLQEFTNLRNNRNSYCH